MKYGKRWEISDEKKEMYIRRLLPQLATLRARVSLSQEELAGLVGISRQTYCLTESGARGMSWNTFLSIVMFYNYNHRTHDLIRAIGAFPEDLFFQFNLGEENIEDKLDLSNETGLRTMFSALDERGMDTVLAVLVSEYARCAELDDDATARIFSDSLKKHYKMEGGRFTSAEGSHLHRI